MKTSEALQRAADAAKMAEAHGLEVWEVARVNDGIDTRVFYGMAQYLVALGDCRDDLEYAIGVCEGKPVWPESVLYDKAEGHRISILSIRNGGDFSVYTWTKPVKRCPTCGHETETEKGPITQDQYEAFKDSKRELTWQEMARIAQECGLKFASRSDVQDYWYTEMLWDFDGTVDQYRLSSHQPDNWRDIVKGLMDRVEFEVQTLGWVTLDEFHDLAMFDISAIRLKE